MVDEVRDRIREFVSAQTPGVRVDDDEDLFASGLVNSLFAVQLVMWVERTFGVGVESRDLAQSNFSSVAAIAGFVAGKQAGTAVHHGL
jgi:methoxymalonate biosynthesis acyl carrier protein